MDYWKLILEKLKNKIHPHTYNKLAKQTYQLDECNSIVTIAVQNERLKRELTVNYASFIEEAVMECDYPDITLNYVIPNGDLNNPLSKITSYLNPLYTFDNFVVGNSNNTAYAACLGVAKEAPSAYNPLYIYGGVGLGKTHIICAIGNAYKNSKKLILFTNADKFMNAIVFHLKNQKLNELREAFLKCDILLMDDVQFLIGKERTQEELFYIFDEMHSQKKQIVFTSDCPPNNLNIAERLKSRFQWGLSVDIQPPDLETKIAILHKKAKLRNFQLPEDVALFIASKVKSNVRELEGALLKVFAMASIKSSSINLEFAKSVLKDLYPDEDKIITPSQIIECISKEFQLKSSALFSKSNEKRVVTPRQIAMFLCKKLTNYSLVEISNLFKKNHSTVIYSINKIEDKIKKEHIFKQQMDAIIQKIKTL